MKYQDTQSFIAFQVQAFTLSRSLHRAFGYYAVCWLLLNHFASCPTQRYRFHQVRSPLAMNSKEPRHLLTRASLVNDRSLVKQISPDKNVDFHYTTASFTLPIRSRGFDVLGHLASRLSLVWCFCPSARSFASGFLQTVPRGLALAIR